MSGMHLVLGMMMLDRRRDLMIDDGLSIAKEQGVLFIYVDKQTKTGMVIFFFTHERKGKERRDGTEGWDGLSIYFFLKKNKQKKINQKK